MRPPSQRPAVSCVIPVRNGARTIAQSIESVRAQSMADWELVIVDNGSTDDTASVIAQYANADARIRAITEPEPGIVPALNSGIAAAQSDLIARLDADDMMRPSRLALQVAALRAKPDCVLVASRYEVWDEHAGTRRIEGVAIKGDALSAQLLNTNVIAHPTVTMRRWAFDQAGGYRAAFAPAEDLDLWLRMARVGTMAILDEPLIVYRIHSGQVTSLKSPRNRMAMAAVYGAHLGAPIGASPQTQALTFVRSVTGQSSRDHVKIAARALSAIHETQPHDAEIELRRIRRALLGALRIKDAATFHKLATGRG